MAARSTLFVLGLCVAALCFACGCCTPALPGRASVAGNSVTLDAPSLDAPVNLVRNSDFRAELAPWRTTKGHEHLFTIIDTPRGPCPRAVRATVDADSVPNEWDIMLRQAIDEPLPEGEDLVLKAWLRSPQSCRASFFVELGRDPWTKSPFLLTELTPEWREYELRGTCAQPFGIDDAQVGFHLAHDTGTIDIAGVSLTAADVVFGSLSRRATPERPKPLIVNGDFRAPLEGNWETSGPEYLEMTVSDQDGPASPVLSIRSTPTSDLKPWDVCLFQTSRIPLREGEEVHVSFRARSAEKSRISVLFEGAYEPYTKILQQELLLTPDWRDYSFSTTVGGMYGRGETHLKFYLGHEAANLELAGVRADSHGQVEPAQPTPADDQ